MRDHDSAVVSEQSFDLARCGRSIEPVPALARTDHIERPIWQTGLLSGSLDILDLHPGLGIQAPRLYQQRSGDVHARDYAPVLSEQAREAARTRSKIDHARTRTRDASRGETIKQLGRKPRAVTRVIRGGTSEIGGASGHSDAQHKLDLTTLRSSGPHKEEVVVRLAQTQLAGAVADRAEITRADAKRVLDALEDVVLDEIANAEKVKIGGLVQLTVRVKPASKARKGRNPATGEEITIWPAPVLVDTG